MKTWKKIVLIVLALILVFGGGYGVYYFTYSYKPTSDMVAAEANYTYTEEKDWIIFPSAQENAPGIIIYQGARVDSYSYANLAHELQTAGYNVFISRMPGNWAFFNIDLAGDIVAANPNIHDWYLGGHSLGGSMAASYVYAHKDDNDIKGLFFLASYPAQDFSDWDLPMLFIFGENDGLVTEQKQAQYLPNQSASPLNEVDVIPGANHAQFGTYGPQDGDNPASISVAQQQSEISRELVLWIQKVQNNE